MTDKTKTATALRPSFNAGQIRADLNLRFGELVQHMLSQNEADITSGMKTALLIAQAAERSLRLAAKAGMIALDHDRIAATTRPLHKQTAGFLELDDKLFAKIGAPADTPLLQEAQATWLGAQAYLNNEITAVNDEIRTPTAASNAITMTNVYADGFRNAAAGYYHAAADLLRVEGASALADRLEEVAAIHEPFEAGRNTRAPTPHNFLRNFLAIAHKADQPAAHESLLQHMLERTAGQKPPEKPRTLAPETV